MQVHRNMFIARYEEFDCDQDDVAYNIEDAFFMRKYAPGLKELPMNLITRLRLCEERKR